MKTFEDRTGCSSSFLSFIFFALVAIAVLLTSDLPARAQDAQWQPYTSSDYQFTVLEPGPVTVGTIGAGAGTTFSVKSKDCEYYILARKLSTEERISSWFSTDVLWEAFLKAYGSKPTTVKDASGKGWIGKAFTQISADKPKKSGIFALSTNRDINYYAIVAGPDLPIDVNKFLDSFEVTEKPDNTITNLISLVLFSLFALSLVITIALIARSKAKKK